MNSAAKVYHFVIVTKLLLTFLALKFNPSDILLNFYRFYLHFENYHILSSPHTLHNVIFANLLSFPFVLLQLFCTFAIDMMTASEIIEFMESQQDDAQRQILMRFFKTGPGEYGEGDQFLGLKVPQTREVVGAVPKDFPLNEIPALLMSRWHEVRLCGLLILVAKFERLATKRLANDEAAIRSRDEILTMYLQYAEQANNWDLVDLSVHKILGHWLLLPSNLGDRDYKIKVLDELAQSPCLWKQRMSIVCSWKTSQQGDPSWCLRYAEIHLHHPHDLMHKAVGWMLREMGKRVGMDLLRDFLHQHAHEMPRTALRYAIEKMPEPERQYWMQM